MEYRVKELADLSGVSERTLRYYDQIGLLKPARAENGYRIYGQRQVDRLQEILFYRQMDLPLEEIRTALELPAEAKRTLLETHLHSLVQKQSELEALIKNVRQTLCAWRGEETMSDKQKFEGFKQQLIRENEEAYGAEVEAKYGRDALESANQKIAGMTQPQWQHQEELNARLIALLKQAMKKDDPACEEAQQAADLHRLGCACSGRTVPILHRLIAAWRRCTWRMSVLQIITISAWETEARHFCATPSPAIPARADNRMFCACGSRICMIRLLLFVLPPFC